MGGSPVSKLFIRMFVSCSAESGEAGADDRAGRTAESFEAVRAVGYEPVVAVLSALSGKDHRVEHPPQQNTERMLPRALS